MATLTTYVWGTVLRTREDDRATAWDMAVQLVMDHVNTNEWDDVPTHEPMNVSTGVLHEWGYYGWADDTRHRTTPRARKNRATK